ncbi:MAG: DUF3552 domain-containing protein [Myxococcales bacterium]|nr:DUF3552 domain-containing protein [Myxococcales bacterium]
MLIIAASALAGAALGLGGTTLQRRRQRARQEAAELQRRGARLAAVSDRRAELIHAGERDAQVLRADLDTELSEFEAMLAGDDARLTSRSEAADRRAQRQSGHQADLDARFEAFSERRGGLTAQRDAIRDAERQVQEAVEHSAGMTREAVIEELREGYTEEAALAAAKAARLLEDDTTERREHYATRVMEIACQRYGAPLPADRLISQVVLPKAAKVKERLLADDRGILRLLTELTTVEFEPQEEEAFHLRAADPYTREIGRLAYERLVRSGNVTEASARSQAAKAEKDLEKTVRDAGNRAARILELKDIHPEILFLVGKLLYRTSYTQNQWQHAIETAHLCGVMAQELGLPILLARRAALLHDIGKVLWEETEAVGSHAVSGATFARAHGEDPDVVHPIAAHHNDEKPSTPLAHLVAAADALSGARPGARRETLEAYKQRVDDLERISADYPEVRRAYVIQGGRELQLIVDPQRVDDLSAIHLSEDVAGRIEEECVYPGQIKVTVVREIRRSAVSR